MDDCVFCRIVRGELPSRKVFEDEDFVVIMDVNPVAKGHVLVIPKEHSRWVWDMDDDLYSKCMTVVRKVAFGLKKAFNTECVQEVIAGYGVAHTHVNLFPRIEDDGLPEIPVEPISPKLGEDEMTEIFERIKGVF